LVLASTALFWLDNIHRDIILNFSGAKLISARHNSFRRGEIVQVMTEEAKVISARWKKPFLIGYNFTGAKLISARRNSEFCPGEIILKFQRAAKNVFLLVPAGKKLFWLVKNFGAPKLMDLWHGWPIIHMWGLNFLY
jgi:hypothetical protein